LDKFFNELCGDIPTSPFTETKESRSSLNIKRTTNSIVRISLLNHSTSSLSSQTLNEMKNLAFKLKNYLSVDIFAEEFISYEGIKRLIDLIQITSGNTRSYAMNGFKSLLLYLNSMEYIRENSEVIFDLYEILIKNDNINTISYTLGILILICDYLKQEAVDILIQSIQEHAMDNEVESFKQLVKFIDDPSLDIKVNAMTLICLLIQYTSEKNKQAKILFELNDAGLNKILENNSDCKSQEFQIQLTNFQKLTGEIIRGSNYEIEIYKKKLKDIERHCQELEKKVEFVFLNQKFYDEIVDDFVYFKNLSETCADSGGYYDPCKINKCVYF